uniref:Uncharacterized protein n=1 Tax=Romanomermis culicivorax TaxID=13658 RepID=A0A915KYY3_ROMCU
MYLAWTIVILLKCLHVMCDADSPALFFELAEKHTNIVANCVVPTLRKPVTILSSDLIWDGLTEEEQKAVMTCHSFLDPHCYNGFFKSVNRGYALSFVENTCALYRPSWEPCCNNTDPFGWTGPLRAYCPLYMGDCTGLRVINTDGCKPDYSGAPLDAKLSKFDAMCPNFNEYCSPSNKKIQHAIRYLNLCYSLADYSQVANCSAEYSRPDQLRELEGCKKCHKYCKRFFN